MKPPGKVIDVNFEELEALLERARQGPLGEEDYRKLEAAIHTLSYLIDLIAHDHPSGGCATQKLARRKLLILRRAAEFLEREVTMRQDWPAKTDSQALIAGDLKNERREKPQSF